MKRRTLWAFILLPLVLSAPASAQGVMSQSGSIVTGHLPVWEANRVARDAGSAAGNGPGISELLQINPATPAGSGPNNTHNCFLSAPANVAHYGLCFDASALNGGLISFNAYNGAAAKDLHFNVNGSTSSYPGNGTGNILGPISSTLGSVPLYNNTAGSLLKDPAMLIQQAGGEFLFQRPTTLFNNLYDFRILRTANYSGGSGTTINSALHVLTNVSAGAQSFEWNAFFGLDNSSTVADGGQNVALYANSLQRSTGATFGLLASVTDLHGANPVAPSVGVEIDGQYNGTDNNTARALLNLVLYNYLNGAAPTANAGILLSTGGVPVGTYNYGIEFLGKYNIGIDFSHATSFGSTAIQMANNNTMAWSADGLHMQYWDTSCIQFDNVFGLHRQSLCGDGQIRASDGTVSLRLVPSSTAGIVGTYTNSDLVLFANSIERMRLPAAGGVLLGLAVGTNPVTVTGEVAFNKIVEGSAPVGAGYMKIAAVAGTNAGTCKLVAYAGTSATPINIVDNVGAGC